MLRAALPLLGLPLAWAAATEEPTQEPGSPGEPLPGLVLFRWQWHEVEAPYLVALWILVASLAKIGECVGPGAGRQRTRPRPLVPKSGPASCPGLGLGSRFHDPGFHGVPALSLEDFPPLVGALRICLFPGLP